MFSLSYGDELSANDLKDGQGADGPGQGGQGTAATGLNQIENQNIWLFHAAKNMPNPILPCSQVHPKRRVMPYKTMSSYV